MDFAEGGKSEGELVSPALPARAKSVRSALSGGDFSQQPWGEMHGRSPSAGGKRLARTIEPGPSATGRPRHGDLQRRAWSAPISRRTGSSLWLAHQQLHGGHLDRGSGPNHFFPSGHPEHGGSS